MKFTNLLVFTISTVLAMPIDLKDKSPVKPSLSHAIATEMDSSIQLVDVPVEFESLQARGAVTTKVVKVQAVTTTKTTKATSRTTTTGKSSSKTTKTTTKTTKTTTTTSLTTTTSSTTLATPHLVSQDAMEGIKNDDWLNAHNTRRASPPFGKPVPTLQWSRYLQGSAADYALKLAKSCKFEHSSMSSLVPQAAKYGNGENLFGLIGTDVLSAEQALKAYVEDEVVNFDQTTKKCVPGTVCGHLTQVLWSRSTHVGCAVAINPSCFPDANGETAPYIVSVCHYRRPGNCNTKMVGFYDIFGEDDRSGICPNLTIPDGDPEYVYPIV